MTKTTSTEPHQILATPAQPAASAAGRRLFNEWSLASLGLVVFCGMQILGVWELHLAEQGEVRAGLARALTLLLLAGTAILVALVDRWRRRHFDQCAVLLQATRMNTQLREEKGAAYQLASYDHLTGLPNRMLFSELANSHLSRTRRSHAPFVMMFLDLDRFKLINDTLGHRIGDLLLQGVGQRLSNTVREADIVARLGGDEFVVLLTELESFDDAGRVANKLIEEIGLPMQIEEHELEMRPSIGIAVHPRDGLDLDALMRNADSAMYEAKRAGRGCFRFYDPTLNSRSVLQADLSSRFRRAIMGGEFILHYQPRISLNGYRITSLEALIRWQHPERGLVFPGEFIDYAEQEGLVVELGNWVLRETCRQIAAWLAEGIKVVPVAINVSPKQLRDQTFVNYIREVVSDYGIPANLLEIEITERCVVEDFERPRQALEALSGLGLKIALDDYGTGFSSLSFLKRLPINVIKIDRSFISDIRNQSNDAAIVASTIALGHNLGLTVIAEGVETREQLIYLRAAGCDEVQGYYFQKPVAAAEIVEALKAGEVVR
ncbi:GGDEF-domain containing protein [Parazoarcus communis]|uniref:GGDEF-domain containing protein n=1 Tax=Parazoarcus communis TaxID=41977 RepID=A0A2U8H6S5_9RHOO|nr:EAL domain-containing protein [Parazoarcus communis]AWI80465.1 GGDEF-domain containing protein [Parazoarcus communis]